FSLNPSPPLCPPRPFPTRRSSDLDQLPPLLLTIKTFPCSQIRPYATSTLIMVSPPHYIELNYYYLTYKIHFHPISIRNPNIHITYKKVVRSHVQLNFLYF